MHLVYINLSIGSVFDSQVVSLLKYYIKANLIPTITLVCGIQNEGEKQIVINKFNNINIELIFFKVYPNYSFTNTFQTKTIVSAIKKIKSTKKTVFHLRGELLSLYLSGYFRSITNNVVVDIRGAALEEVTEFQKKNIATRFKLSNIKKSLSTLHKYKHISVISPALKRYIIERAGINAERISVVPCIADEIFRHNPSSKTNIRKELSVSATDTMVAFSSGGMATWQNFNTIDELANMGIWVLNLSKAQINNPKVINKFANYSDMPHYLSACDAGVLIRNNSLVNEVACPVKFVEYVCSGIPVIANKTVELVNDYVEQTGNGIILNTIGDLKIEMLSDLKQLSCSKISNDAVQRFGILKACDSYLKIYNS